MPRVLQQQQVNSFIHKVNKKETELKTRDFSAHVPGAYMLSTEGVIK